MKLYRPLSAQVRIITQWYRRYLRLGEIPSLMSLFHNLYYTWARGRCGAITCPAGAVCVQAATL